jgi:hypothetical protein
MDFVLSSRFASSAYERIRHAQLAERALRSRTYLRGSRERGQGGDSSIVSVGTRALSKLRLGELMIVGLGGFRFLG